MLVGKAIERAQAKGEDHNALPLVWADLTTEEHGGLERITEGPDEVITVLGVAEAVEGEHHRLCLVDKRLGAGVERRTHVSEALHELL